MEVKGTVVSIDIDVQVAKQGGGSYPGSRLTYRDEAGAIKEKAFHNNVFKFNAPLKVQLSNLKANDVFIMTLEKEGEFWNCKGIVPAGQVAAVADKDTPATGKTTPYTSPKSTYETPEERAKKQIYIVRQSSITSAINYKGGKASVEEILKIASQFEAFVFGEQFDDGMPMSMVDDSGDIV